jgi:hypothetical protein
VQVDKPRHALVNRLQPQFRALPGSRLPPPVVDGPEAASAFVDYPVPARSRSWVDAYDFHGNTLGIGSDAPPPPHAPRRTRLAPGLRAGARRERSPVPVPGTGRVEVGHVGLEQGLSVDQQRLQLGYRLVAE